MGEVRRVIVVLFFAVILILFFAGLQVITGDAISINKNTLTQKNEMTKIIVLPKIVKVEKIGDILIKDKIMVQVTPGSGGAYKKVEFFQKGSSSVFEEFDLKCEGFKCIKPVTGYQLLDNKWKTGTYTARVKDASTNNYTTTEFKVETIF